MSIMFLVTVSSFYLYDASAGEIRNLSSVELKNDYQPCVAFPQMVEKLAGC